MNECPKCGGSGWIIVKNDQVETAERCPCIIEHKSAKLLEAANIPARYADCTITTFRGINDSAKFAKDLAYKYITDFPGDGRGLLIMGSCGVGKTHLGVAVLRYLIDTYSTTCLFYDFRQLLQDIRATYTSEDALTESEIFMQLSRVKVLLLDELGAEKITGWLLDTLTYLINYRYNHRQITLITTNYLDDRTKKDDEILQDRIGYRLRSRLYDMCYTIILDGQDRRKQYSERAMDRMKKSMRRNS